MPLTPALIRQRQGDFSEFKPGPHSLVLELKGQEKAEVRKGRGLMYIQSQRQDLSPGGAVETLPCWQGRARFSRGNGREYDRKRKDLTCPWKSQK